MGKNQDLPVKIGVTSDVKARLRQAKVGCPYALHAMHLVPFDQAEDAYAFEDAMKPFLSHWRTDGGGEWREFPPDVLAWILSIGAWDVALVMHHMDPYSNPFPEDAPAEVVRVFNDVASHVLSMEIPMRLFSPNAAITHPHQQKI